ncbi:MAG: hypothetical protein AB1700_21475 [Bacillota bacterium]
MNREQGEQVYIIWDNSTAHKAIAEEYEAKYQAKVRKRVDARLYFKAA